MSWRARLTRMLLWISVLAWEILLGGKLFDLLVLAGAWSASLVCSFAVLIAGWKTPARYRVWLVLPAVMITVNLVFTVNWFWPHNRALWHVAIGAPDALRDRAEIMRMANQWVSYDWLRVAMGVVGFVSSVRAISVPFPERQDFRAAKAAK